MRSLARRRTRFRSWSAVVSVLLVALIGAGILLAELRAGPGTGAVQGTLSHALAVSTVSSAGLSCPHDAAFSPREPLVVVLGTLGTCDDSAATPSWQPSAAVLYDSTTGATRGIIPLDRFLGIASASVAQRRHIQWVSYAGLGFAPDGAHLGVVYTEFGQSEEGSALTPESVVDAGLLYLDAQHGTAQVLRGDSSFFGASSGPGGQTPAYPLWNVRTGAEQPAFATAPSFAYAWGGAGQPQPLAPVRPGSATLPTIASARSPVGTPDGGATFTIWQPGLLAGPGNAGVGPGHAAFLTLFPTWSPDGRSVTLIDAGLAQPDARRPSTRGAVLPYPLPAQGPLVAPRDPAEEAVEQEIGASGQALVAWNPSGTLLASVTCGTTHPLLEMRETASGSLTGAQPLSIGAGPSACALSAQTASAYPRTTRQLLWSSDGTVILMTDRAGGTLSFWHVSPPPEG